MRERDGACVRPTVCLSVCQCVYVPPVTRHHEVHTIDLNLLCADVATPSPFLFSRVSLRRRVVVVVCLCDGIVVGSRRDAATDTLSSNPSLDRRKKREKESSKDQEEDSKRFAALISFFLSHSLSLFFFFFSRTYVDHHSLGSFSFALILHCWLVCWLFFFSHAV